MSVTAVPLHPVKKGSVLKLWIALAFLSAVAGGVAFAGTAGQMWERTASGLQYQVVEEGTGERPKTSDIAIIEYKGSLPDGTVFDSNEGRPAPLPVDPSATIPGFAEGLQLMRKGGTYRLRIPSELGYGERGAPPAIPPNTDLEFQVKLVEFMPESAFRAMMSMGMPGGAGGAGGAGGGAPGGEQAPPPQGE
jgi:FKBP-type peptidyl-prolyl cis-trans isomerase FkpA